MTPLDFAPAEVGSAGSDDMASDEGVPKVPGFSVRHLVSEREMRALAETYRQVPGRR